MAEKVILPNEVKVCATCTYWDGERQVDDDMKLVVVLADGVGECLVTGLEKAALQDSRKVCVCLWEDLEPDQVPDPKPLQISK